MLKQVALLESDHGARFALAGLVILEIFIGVMTAAISLPLSAGVMVLLGVLATVAAFRHPVAGLVGMMFLSIQILALEYLPGIRLSIGTINLVDLSLLLMVGYVAISGWVRGDWMTWVGRSALSIPMAVFVGFVILSLPIGISNGNPPVYVVGESRNVFWYLLFLVALYVVRTRTHFDRLLGAMFIMACIVALLMISSAFLGRSAYLAYKNFALGPLILFLELTDTGIVQRVTFGGELLVMVAAVCCGCYAIHNDNIWRRLWLTASSVMFTVALIVTGRRVYWIAVPLGFLLAFASSRNYLRLNKSLMSLFMLISLLGLGGLVFTQTYESEAGGDIITATTARLSSLMSLSAFADPEDTMAWRWRESQLAWRVISTAPLQGIGIGGLFGFWRQFPGPWGSEYAPQTYVHNGYLWLWLKLGLGGLLAFVWVSVTFIVRIHSLLTRALTPETSGLLAGLLGSYVSILVVTFTDARFSSFSWISVIALLLALPDIADRVLTIPVNYVGSRVSPTVSALALGVRELGGEQA